MCRERKRVQWESERTVFAKRRRRREELRQHCVLVFFIFFVSIAVRHVFRCGDAVPLSLPNRAGRSLGSAAVR